jgi:hypothetical protein
MILGLWSIPVDTYDGALYCRFMAWICLGFDGEDVDYGGGLGRRG